MIDHRQHARVARHRRVAVAGGMRRDHRTDQIGNQARCHGSGCAGIEIGQKRDSLLPVERSFDGIAGGFQKRPHLCRDAGGLDLEQLHHFDLGRHACQQRHRKLDPGQRRVLDHDRDSDIANHAELVEGLLRVALQKRAVIGRHHHHDGRAKLLCLAGPRHRDVGREMADGDDDRKPAGHMFQAQPCQMLALGIRDQELLGEIGEDADAVASLIDHAVENAAHAVVIDGTGLGEGCRGDRPDAAIGTCWHGFV